MQHAAHHASADLSGDDRDALLDALETLSVAVTVLDAEGRLLFASDGLNRLFRGLPPWPDLVGRSYEEIVRLGVPEVAACALGDDAKTFLALRFSRLGRRTRVPLTVPLADGRVIAIRARPCRQGGTVLVWSEKRPGPEPDAAGALALFSDPALLRTLGHTLKTPLNAILGFSDLMATMADTLSPAQVREYAGFVHQGGANLLKRLGQTMDLARLSAGQYALSRAPLDADGVLWQARERFLVRAAEKAVTIETAAAPGLALLADAHALAIMLDALLDNALRHTLAGGRITLSAARRDGGVRLCVADDGPGVAKSDLRRILEPFGHAGRPEAQDGGAGLGLTLVRALAQCHGGWLSLDSSEGEGFRAAVVLPAA